MVSTCSAFASAYLHFFCLFFCKYVFERSFCVPFSFHIFAVKLHCIKFPHSCNQHHIYSTITISLCSILHTDHLSHEPLVSINLLLPALLCCNINGSVFKYDIFRHRHYLLYKYAIRKVAYLLKQFNFDLGVSSRSVRNPVCAHFTFL